MNPAFFGLSVIAMFAVTSHSQGTFRSSVLVTITSIAVILSALRGGAFQDFLNRENHKELGGPRHQFFREDQRFGFLRRGSGRGLCGLALGLRRDRLGLCRCLFLARDAACARAASRDW